MNIFSIFFKIKVYCVFSLESPHRGDSNVYTQYTCTIFIIIITPDYSKSAVKGFLCPATKSGGYYVIPSELLSVCLSVRPSVCPSVRPSVSG